MGKVLDTPNNGCDCPEGYTPTPDGKCQQINEATPIFPDAPIYVGTVCDISFPRGVLSYGSLNTYTWPLLTAPQCNTSCAYGGLTDPNAAATLAALTPIPDSGTNSITGDSWTSISPPAQVGGQHDVILTPIPTLPSYYLPTPNTLGIPSESCNYPMYQSTINAGVLQYGQGSIVPYSGWFLSNASTNPWYSWMKDICVWQDTAGITFKWAGFIVCLEPVIETTYQILITCNNGLRIFVDDNLAVEMLNGDGFTPALCKINHFELTLSPGLHKIRIENYNYGGSGGFSCDILKCSQTQLFALGPNPPSGAGYNPGLMQYRVFSTFWKIPRPMIITANGTDTITISSANNPPYSPAATQPYDIGGFFDAPGFPPSAKVIQVLGPNTYKLDTNIPAGTYGLPATPARIRFLYDVSNLTGNSFTCPEGYELVNCDGLSCVQTITIDNVCNLLLTPCCGEMRDPIIIEPQQGLSYLNEGQTVCINDIAGASNGCWTISVSHDPATYTDPFTVGTLHTGCEDCTGAGCRDCINNFYVLKDCCTNEPYKIKRSPTDDSLILVFNYTGTPSVGLTPSSLNGLGIESFSFIDNSYKAYGCWYLEQIETLPSGNNVVPWDEGMDSVTTVPSCEDCACCIESFVLTNCVDTTESIVVAGDLVNYITGVVNLESCPTDCYTVAENVDCTPCTETVVVKESYEPTGGYVKTCVYVSPRSELPITDVTIVANGTLYTAAYSVNPVTLIANLNALNVGVFTINEYAGVTVTGAYTYGQFCTVGTSIQCVDPTCSINQLKSCVYGPVSNEDTKTTFSIEIDGFVYTSPVIDFNSYIYVLFFLNSLNKGTFSINPISTSPFTYEIVVTGNHDYGDITWPGKPDPITLTPECADLVDPQTACAECLPSPPPPSPIQLITRKVKPGYTTPGCSPEYTEKVNCAFAEQVYQIMISKRYGLTACCEDNYQYWQIKKALLDFESINPTTDSLIPEKACYCFTLSVTVGSVNFRYINCEGCATTITVSEGSTTYVCSQSYPSPLCTDSTIQPIYEITTENAICTTTQQCIPPPTCYCITFINEEARIAGVDVYTCENGNIGYVLETGQSVSVCGDPNSIVITSGPLTVNISNTPCDLNSECQK